MLREEAYLAIPDTEHAFLKVDARLMRPEHVEPEEEVGLAVLDDLDRAREMEIRELELRAVYTPEDLRGTDAERYTGEVGVQEAHDTACLRALGTHCED